MRIGGAGTIVNAMAIGRGAAFGLGYQVSARLRPSLRWEVLSEGRRLESSRARLAITAARHVLGESPRRIEVRSDIPMERGLKSSSAVSLAVLEAAADEIGVAWSDPLLLDAAATVGLASGTSLTGAYDDAAACLLGGVVVTDNRRRRLLARFELPRGLAALVHVPPSRRKTSSVRHVDFSKIASLVDDAHRLVLKRQVREAMILNTAAYAPLFGLRARFVGAALEGGAYAAGLSGKGPAEVALGRPDLLRTLRRRFPNTRLIPLRRGTRQ